MQINNAGQNGTELNMELAASIVDEAGMVSIYSFIFVAFQFNISTIILLRRKVLQSHVFI